MTEKTSESIQDKNLEILKELEGSEKKVIIKEVDGKQRLYVEFSDDLYLVFEGEDGSTELSFLAVDSNRGDEFDMQDFILSNKDAKMTEDDLIPVKDKIKDYFTNFSGKLGDKEQKVLETIMSTLDITINLEKDTQNISSEVKFNYDLSKIERENESNQKCIIKGDEVVDLTNDEARKKYYKYLYRKIPDKFSIVINFDDNKEVSFNYDRSKFNDFGECMNLDSLIEIEPEGTELSDEEKKTAIEKLGNTICENFVPFHIDDPNLNSAANRATRLFKASASAFLENEQQINYATMDYLKTTNKTIINYSNEKNLDSQESISNVYIAVLPEISKSIVVNFKSNEEKFIKDFLDDSNVLCVEKIFDSLKEKEKKCGFIEFISNENFLNDLTPEQFGKLAAVISRIGMPDLKLSATEGCICKKMADVISNYDESKVQTFSKSFANNVNGLFFRKDKTQMRADSYASITLNIVKYLNDNEVCKNNIITNVYNIMPNFVDPSKKLSKLSFVEGLKDAGITVENTIKDDSILQDCATCDEKDPRLKEAKNYIKTPEDGGVILSNLLSQGRIDENTIQNYFEGFKKCGFNVTGVVKSAIDNIKGKEDIYPFVKKALITNLCLLYHKYERNKGNNPSESIKNEVTNGDFSTNTKHNKIGYVTFTINDKDLIELFFNQQQEAIETLKTRGIKQDLIRPEIDKIEKNKMIFEKIRKTVPHFEFYNSKDKYSINKAGSALVNLLYDGNNNKETLETYFNNFGNLGFPVGEVVISAAESISKDEEIYPFVRKAIVDNLSAVYMTPDRQRDRSGEMRKFRIIKEEIDKDNKKRPIMLKNKEKRAISLDLKSELLDSFFDKEKKSIDNLAKQTGQKREAEKQESILNKNKTVIQKLRENSPELFVKSNEAVISVC